MVQAVTLASMPDSLDLESEKTPEPRKEDRQRAKDVVRANIGRWNAQRMRALGYSVEILGSAWTFSGMTMRKWSVAEVARSVMRSASSA